MQCLQRTACCPLEDEYKQATARSSYERYTQPLLQVLLLLLLLLLLLHYCCCTLDMLLRRSSCLSSLRTLRPPSLPLAGCSEKNGESLLLISMDSERALCQQLLSSVGESALSWLLCTLLLPLLWWPLLLLALPLLLL
jgi:hypothetical protein